MVVAYKNVEAQPIFGATAREPAERWDDNLDAVNRSAFTNTTHITMIQSWSKISKVSLLGKAGLFSVTAPQNKSIKVKILYTKNAHASQNGS